MRHPPPAHCRLLAHCPPHSAPDNPTAHLAGCRARALAPQQRWSWGWIHAPRWAAAPMPCLQGEGERHSWERALGVDCWVHHHV